MGTNLIEPSRTGPRMQQKLKPPQEDEFPPFDGGGGAGRGLRARPDDLILVTGARVKGQEGQGEKGRMDHHQVQMNRRRLLSGVRRRLREGVLEKVGRRKQLASSQQLSW